jgi:hypothetical protein
MILFSRLPTNAKPSLPAVGYEKATELTIRDSFYMFCKAER